MVTYIDFQIDALSTKNLTIRNKPAILQYTRTTPSLDGVQLVAPEVLNSECVLAWPYWQTVGLLNSHLVEPKMKKRRLLQALWG